MTKTRLSSPLLGLPGCALCACFGFRLGLCLAPRRRALSGSVRPAIADSGKWSVGLEESGWKSTWVQVKCDEGTMKAASR